jgi:hypothetical protein
MRRRGPLRPESAAGDKNGQESKGGKKKLSLVLAGIVSSLFFTEIQKMAPFLSSGLIIHLSQYHAVVFFS